MRNRVIDLTVTVPMSANRWSEDKLIRFARWCERPLTGAADVRIEAFVALASSLCIAFEAHERGGPPEVGHA